MPTPTTEPPSGPFSALHTDGLPTPTSTQNPSGISSFYIPYSRPLGPIRFTLGVMKELVLKSGYPCSFATSGTLTPAEAVNANGDEEQRRVATKAIIKQHYHSHYDAQVAGEVIATGRGASLSTLVGTKRPMVKWEQSHNPSMYSFYAGKVISFHYYTDEKMPWTSRTAHAFPAALSNDGYIDLCVLNGNIGHGPLLKIFQSFDKGYHFNDKHVPIPHFFLT
jgi:hypothetical protein